MSDTRMNESDDFTRHDFCADCRIADIYCYAGTILSSWVFYLRTKGECPYKRQDALLPDEVEERMRP